MSCFYDVMSQFVGHHIIVDNAKSTTTHMDCNHTIEMPPLQRNCYRDDNRRKRMFIKQQKQQQESKISSSFSITSSSVTASNMQLKEERVKDCWTLLIIPSKTFHCDDATMSTEKKKHDIIPKAPIRKQAYYDIAKSDTQSPIRMPPMTTSTMMISPLTQQCHRKCFSSDGKVLKNGLLPIPNTSIARVA